MILVMSDMFAATTCATVLTHAIFLEGCKSVAAGMNVMDLRHGITMVVDAVMTNLKSRAQMISTYEEIAHVHFICSVAVLKCECFCTTDDPKFGSSRNKNKL